MTTIASEHRFDTVVIGGGQAGLAIGYYLKKQGRKFVILEAGERVGDAWRNRWDSLRLFTPATLSGLPGMPFPFQSGYFPTKGETADYLEEYARKFPPPKLRHHSNGHTFHPLLPCGSERLLYAALGDPQPIWWHLTCCGGPGRSS